MVSSEGLCAADVAWLSCHYMFDPSPSPSHDDGAHVAVVAAGDSLVEDGLEPEYSQDFSKVLGVKGGQFVKVKSSSSILSCRVGWKIRSSGSVLIVVLYEDNFHTLFSI